MSAALRRTEIDVPCRDVGLPQRFYDHASRPEVLADAGLTEQDVARQITGWAAALGGSVSGSGDDAGRDGLKRSRTIGLEPEISEHLD